MDKFRLRITVALNGNHALSEQQLQALKPVIARGVAGCLPPSLHVDTVIVTRIRSVAEKGERV